MKIKLRNLGILREAEFTLGDLNIICGKNNTGKTYATYALYGFLTFWEEAFYVDVFEKYITTLLKTGSIELNLDEYLDKYSEIINAACSLYSPQLKQVFASGEKHFVNSELIVGVDASEILPLENYSSTMGTSKNQLIDITKNANSRIVSITLLAKNDKVNIPLGLLKRIIGESLKDILFKNTFPKPFIASAERTGAAIFRKELNFSRNRALEMVSKSEGEFNPYEFLNKVFDDYALPVKANVDFTRQLEGLTKKESYIYKFYPDILVDFENIIGGEYIVTKKDELYYTPSKYKRLKLTMDGSSSAVRSLLDIGFYIRHVAEKGDLLMIDEPELNLHPENQRNVARLLARLVNAGIKVFITTHSDYIVKELSILMMMNHPEPRLKKLAQREGYQEDELIKAEQLKVYIAEEDSIKLEGKKNKTKCHTLREVKVDPKHGIDAWSFDDTIETMNRIQDEIVWGEDE